MKTFIRLFIFLLIGAPPVFGQAPKTAGSGPVVSASLGYSYFSLGLQPVRANLNGLDTTFTVDFNPRFGVRLDLGYVRGSDVNGSTHHADVLSYLVGPVFYIWRGKRLTTYVHALGGGARITGAIPGPIGFIRGYENRPALAVGAGLEYQIYSSLAVRAGADYIRASYLTSPTAYGGQNDFRGVTSLVYYFGSNRR
jgi:opacity protein-like surface antigen